MKIFSIKIRGLLYEIPYKTKLYNLWLSLYWSHKPNLTFDKVNLVDIESKETIKYTKETQTTSHQKYNSTSGDLNNDTSADILNKKNSIDDNKLPLEFYG